MIIFAWRFRLGTYATACFVHSGTSLNGYDDILSVIQENLGQRKLIAARENFFLRQDAGKLVLRQVDKKIAANKILVTGKN